MRVHMPEGHTVHRIARDHGRLLVGQVLRVSSPQGRFADSAQRVDGHVLEKLEAVGKHLFYWWDTGDIGHVHLGLFGKFRVSLGELAPTPIGEVRMRLQTTLATIDLAGPTECSIGTPHDRALILRRLGPDPLRRDAPAQVAIDRIRSSKQPVGALLLDQKVLCGVGNVYRAEALFVTGIHPARTGQEIDESEARSLWNTIVAMLRKGVKDNRIITVDRSLVKLTKSGPLRRGEATYVYHRDRCLRCNTPIQTIELGGRPCYFCPVCQPR
jgi:endonuclease-8